MKKGDIVKFKEVIDKGDKEARMILMEDPDGGRVRVKDITDLNIQTTTVYNIIELERVIKWKE